MPDDIDDEIRRLNQRIKELEDLIRQIFTREETEQEAKEEAPTGTEDLYDVGQDSYLVDSLEEYKEMRKAAATSREILLPNLSPSYKGNFPQLYTRAFSEGYDSLDSLKRGLSKDDFGRVIREVFIVSTLLFGEPISFSKEENNKAKSYVLPRKQASLMVELSGAKPDTFGVSEDVKGNVKYASHRTPMPVLQAYDSLWFVRSSATSIKGVARPWESLGLRAPPGIQEALNSDNTLAALYNNNIIVSSGMPMNRFIRESILPKVVRRDRNGLISMTDEMRELADFLDML